MNCRTVLRKLRSLSNPKAVKGMAQFGINSKNTLGVSIPKLRIIAKDIGKDHELAQHLWNSGIHEARLLAGFIDEPWLVTENQMEAWVSDFDSWDVCDQCCSSLFDKATPAWKKAVEWTERKEEFVKRAGFVLMACLAVHDKEARDEDFMKFFPIIKRESTDYRNFVKKAVNWALRQIGKRNARLKKVAISTAEEIAKIDSSTARWIAADALRELKQKKL
jgi:3-methyladenine DNA glycosylase AlkD